MPVVPQSCGRIRDWPERKVRAFMLDVGRKFVPLSYLRDIVRNLADSRRVVWYVHPGEAGYRI